MSDRPNVLLILNDDMGYSDIGCYGGDVDTPNLDRLAGEGLRFTQFYNTARCCPTRASLLTGLHPHQAGIGLMAGTGGPEGYEGTLNRRCVTVAEVLKGSGYRTYMSGKWHVVNEVDEPNDAWPNQRGFDRFYGTITGAGSYFHPNTLTRDNVNVDQEAAGDQGFYYTDAISDNAVAYIDDHYREQADAPFFLYVAYTAPHWPLHAKAADLAKYRGRFDAGWDALREQRLERLVDLGIIDPAWKLSPRDPGELPWEDVDHKAWQARRMETYAAQIDCMDQGIGRILRSLEENGQLDNTLVIFLADNGGCAEEVGAEWASWIFGNIGRATTRDGREVRCGNRPDIMPGPEDTYTSYGVPWANLSNAPFRYYKHWTHEGGIATPFIARWPGGGVPGGELRRQPAQLTDIMATLVETSGAEYPATFNGQEIPPCEGVSLGPVFRDASYVHKRRLFFEHEGNAAVRDGRWKLVRNFSGRGSARPGFDPPDTPCGGWELYDMETDRTELHDLVAKYPDRVAAMAAAYETWANRCGVIPWEELTEILKSKG